jgi:two-component system chemotaxis sensor kinase CheA
LIARLTRLQQAPEAPEKNEASAARTAAAAAADASQELGSPKSVRPKEVSPKICDPEISGPKISDPEISDPKISSAIEELKDANPAPPPDIAVEQPAAFSAEVADAQRAQPAAPGQAASDRTIRLDVALLDQLMNLVGELVLARNQILQFANSTEESGLLATSQRLNLITTELQEGVMKTRMQPIGMVGGK